MAAFPDRTPATKLRTAEGFHDPLWARAVALGDGTITVVVCVADVVAFRWCDVDRMRVAFAQEAGLPSENLILAATHNHNGPDCTYLLGGSPDAAYSRRLRHLTVAAAVDAVANLGAAKIGAAAVEADLSFNRRQISPTGVLRQEYANPERQRHGPVDPRVSVLCVDGADGSPMIALLHFAAHPVIMTNPNRLFTASYPGAAVDRFESLTGVPVGMFLQGAAGDVHPYGAMSNSFADITRLASSLADKAAEAYGLCDTTDEAALAVQRWQGHVPHRYSDSHKVRFEVIVLRLTERIALVFWPGEPYIELSLSLQWRSPFARTIVVGYSGGRIGYLPNRNAYEFGGYGVDLDTRDPPESGRTSVWPGLAECLIDRTAALLESLKNVPREI
jgi:hypothetical protein